MPRIPQYQSETITRSREINAGAASAPYRALSGLGETVSQIGGEIEAYQQKKKAIEQDTIMLKINNMMRDDSRSFAENMNIDTDWRGLPDRAKKLIQNYGERYNKEIGEDPSLMRRFNDQFNSFSNNLQDIASKRSNTLLVDDNRTETDKSLRGLSEDYSLEDDINRREMIKNDMEILLESQTINGTYTKQDAENIKQSWLASAEQERVDSLINNVNNLSYDKLDDYKVYLEKEINKSDLSTNEKTRRLEQVESRVNISKNEQQQEQSKAIKIAHDNEVRQIGDLFIRGTYSEAAQLIFSSNLLTGDEKKTWNDAIQNILKNESPSDIEQASEVVKINSMISSGQNPDDIRKAIVLSPNIKKEDKEQYINKLETKLQSEMDEGRKTGYRYIQDLIIPKRGPESDLLETPLETQKTMLAQQQLDDWIESYKKSGKYPDSREVKAKAIELAKRNKPTVVEMIEYQRQWGTQTAKEVKEYLKQKK